MMMGNYKEALNDSQRAVLIDKQYAKGFERVIKCCLALGDSSGAEQAIEKLAEIKSMKNECKKFTQSCKRLRLHKEASDKWLRVGDYKKAGKCQLMKKTFPH